MTKKENNSTAASNDYICNCPFCKLGRFCKERNDYTAMAIFYESAIIHTRAEIENMKELGFVATGLSTIITDTSSNKEKQGLILSVLECDLDWYEQILSDLKQENKKTQVSYWSNYEI